MYVCLSLSFLSLEWCKDHEIPLPPELTATNSSLPSSTPFSPQLSTQVIITIIITIIIIIYNMGGAVITSAITDVIAIQKLQEGRTGQQ